ncbi:uncharacterized protein N7458_012766 [Penicillium daleae]|uniref:Phosphatidic acid phosphatase type 2/haloperoxidase domain-containing protein n=1 Tax=Penicillium daleae TaxID=63821 RepID=A0AAD6BVX7_9EURO|nr:uncharacterized protein N7458_012766 [Penicillium daleae]KAJ5433610.1 hypothetical protein N7458_012766 [Penicillium daleae]
MGPISPKGAIAHISKLLVLSYIIDWIFIIGVALIGYGFYKQDPNQRPFSLTDPDISFPFTEHETVSTATLVLVSVLAPAVIIILGAALLIPGTAAVGGPTVSRSQLLRRKFWEWNAGWMGLALALAGAWMATQGLKTLMGKPRPDLLARCNPDVKKIAEYAVGGLGERLAGAPVLVDWKICREQGYNLRVDGFSSFPSGHSSLSFAGLGYLTLWLAAKLSVGFPYLPQFPVEGDDYSDERTSVRTRGAAPPVLLMILAFFPTAVAFFIASSRWFNFRHHGFDIICGAIIGIFFAYIGMRMYHLPIQRGAGWAWGPRGSRRAFVRGIGFPSSLGTDSWTYSRKEKDAQFFNGSGHTEPVHDVENIPMQEQPDEATADERV